MSSLHQSYRLTHKERRDKDEIVLHVCHCEISSTLHPHHLAMAEWSLSHYFTARMFQYPRAHQYIQCIDTVLLVSIASVCTSPHTEQNHRHCKLRVMWNQLEYYIHYMASHWFYQCLLPTGFPLAKGHSLTLHSLKLSLQ